MAKTGKALQVCHYHSVFAVDGVHWKKQRSHNSTLPCSSLQSQPFPRRCRISAAHFFSFLKTMSRAWTIYADRIANSRISYFISAFKRSEFKYSTLDCIFTMFARVTKWRQKEELVLFLWLYLKEYMIGWRNQAMGSHTWKYTKHMRRNYDSVRSCFSL